MAGLGLAPRASEAAGGARCSPWGDLIKAGHPRGCCRAGPGPGWGPAMPTILRLVCLSVPRNMERVQVLRAEAVCEPGSRAPASCRAPEGSSAADLSLRVPSPWTSAGRPRQLARTPFLSPGSGLVSMGPAPAPRRLAQDACPEMTPGCLSRPVPAALALNSPRLHPRGRPPAVWG